MALCVSAAHDRYLKAREKWLGHDFYLETAGAKGLQETELPS